MGHRILTPLLFAIALVFTALTPVAAQQPAPPPSAEARAAERNAAWQAGVAAATNGPAQIVLREQAKLDLPDKMTFIPQAEAGRILRALGNQAGADLVGLIITLSPDDSWFVVVRWQSEGYIRDDESKELDADKVLQSLREGTEENNADRRARGFPELVLQGWAQPPAYDSATHRLAWSLKVATKDEPNSGNINFNTRALGREGYFSLNLIDTPDRIERDRPVAATLLGALNYEAGKRYEDFNASTDRIAEYGLLGLIGVVAAKKLGLIALAGVFVLKFAKVGLIALAGIGLALKRFFRRPKA